MSFRSTELVVLPEATLIFDEAQRSPCADCSTTPCCAALPLYRPTIEHALDFEHLGYILNFAHIEVGLASNGEWIVLYRLPCRFLQSGRCLLHDTPKQPRICVNYNPYSCWYKPNLTQSFTDDLLRIDRRRLEVIRSQVGVNDEGRIVSVPGYPALAQAFSRLPLEPPNDEQPPFEDEATRRWRDWIREPSRSLHVIRDQEREPCDGCDATCCDTLLFPYPRAVTRANLDYLKFCLGHPGVELAITDERWSLAVKTRCRHLRDHRCSIYGSPERPQLCNFYDASRCTYREQFGTPRPAGFLRIRLEEFELMSETFRFDENGTILEGMHTDVLRRYVEARLRGQPVVIPGREETWHAPAGSAAPAAPIASGAPATMDRMAGALAVSTVPRQFAVAIVSPPGLPRSEIFQIVAETVDAALRELGHDSAIVTDPIATTARQRILLGPGLLSQPQRLPAGAVLYNLEPLVPRPAWLTPALVENLRRHRLWDASEINLVELRKLGATVEHAPIGHHPSLARLQPREEDIDVLLLGALNQRRRRIVEALAAQGIRVHTALAASVREREELLARARILLHVYAQDTHVLDSVRLSYWLANHRFVICESVGDHEERAFADGVVFARPADLAAACAAFLAAPVERARRVEAGEALLKRRSAVEVLAQLVATLPARPE